MNSKWQDIPTRMLTVAVGAPFIFLATFVGYPLYDIAVVGVGVVAAFELARMMAPQHRFWRFALPLVMVLTILPIAYNHYEITAAVYFVTFIVWYITSRRQPDAASLDGFYLFVALLYVGIPLALLLSARASSEGLARTFVLFITTWMTDGFALIGGRLFGKRKLAPHISAGKTIEGAVTGFIMGSLSGFILLAVTMPTASKVIGLVMTMVISLMTIIGDLIESSVKRHYHVKDAGNILPGHGGFLDRIDGLVLAIPFWCLFVIRL